MTRGVMLSVAGGWWLPAGGVSLFLSLPLFSPRKLISSFRSCLAAAPLPAAHSYGLQPQGAGNSSTTAMTQSVSPSPHPPIPPPNLCDQRIAPKTYKNVMFFNRWTPVLLKVAHRVPECTS